MMKTNKELSRNYTSTPAHKFRFEESSPMVSPVMARDNLSVQSTNTALKEIKNELHVVSLREITHGFSGELKSLKDKVDFMNSNSGAARAHL